MFPFAAFRFFDTVLAPYPHGYGWFSKLGSRCLQVEGLRV